MKLASNTFRNGGVIPGRCAFAVKAPVGHLRTQAWQALQTCGMP